MVAMADSFLLAYPPTFAFPFEGFGDLTPGLYLSWWMPDLGVYPGQTMTTDPIAMSTASYYRNRHGGRPWNVLYCDGHVLGQRTKEIVDPRSDAVLQRWNRDHVPHLDAVISKWRQ